MEKFVVYGAGKIGKAIYQFMEQTNQLDLIHSFCDKNYLDISRSGKFGNISVVAYQDAKVSGLPFVIGIGKNFKDEVLNLLLSDGIPFYESFEDWIRNNYFGAEQLLKQFEFADIRSVGNGRNPVRQRRGICPFCKKETFFISYDSSLIRDNYQCVYCRTSPRGRALFVALEENAPDWRSLKLHEGSPSGPISEYLRDHCRSYSSSYFYEDKPLGETIGENITNQNLEMMTFPDESFDIIITQDVLEHVNEPAKVFREICRVLKKGGKHIFTVPIWREKTFPRIKMENGKRVLTADPIYHGNPISEEGALLTYEWGDDLPEFVDANVHGGGTTTRIIHFPRNEEDLKLGLDAGERPARDNNVIVTEKI